MKQWHLSSTPYEVQLAARRACEDRVIRSDDFGYLMDMGTGKTATTLDDFVDGYTQNKVEGMVVLCPNSLKSNWAVEVKKQGVRANSYIWDGVPKNMDLIKPPFVYPINYEAIRSEKTQDFLEKLLKRHDVMLALDESVAIKNPSSDQTKAAFWLGKRSKIRRILSGQPMPQGPQDLWAQLTFLNALNGQKFYPFRNTYCMMGGFQGRQVIGVQNEHILQRILKTCSFRARKKDWLDLPEKIFGAPRVLELTKAQKKYYEEIENDLYVYISETGEEVSAELVITKLIKLQQIVSGFVITDSKEVHYLEGGSRKLDEAESVMEQLGEKMVIFAFFRPSLDLLGKRLEKYNPVFIRGGMLPGEIEESKRKFNETKECGAIICQITAGKYGHTLLGSDNAGPCSTAMFYENSFSLDDRLQSEDRIHRIGQRNTCNYVDFASTPIEQRIISALQRKLSVAEAVVDGIKTPGLEPVF